MIINTILVLQELALIETAEKFTGKEERRERERRERERKREREHLLIRIGLDGQTSNYSFSLFGHFKQDE